MAIYKVFIKNLNRTIECKSGKLLKDVLIENDLPIELPCGGKSICGACILNIRPLGNKYGFKPVLACSHLIEKDIEIESLSILNENLNSIDENMDIEKDNIKKLSVAIDVGTTGITMSFLDIYNNDIVMVKSFLNPQVQFGNDLISRIDYISNSPEKLNEVRNSLLIKINSILEEVGIEKIDFIVFSANTTMLHILANENPYSIAIYPYEPKFLECKIFNPKKFYNWNFKVIFLPNASAYIGSDIISGVFSTDFYKRNDNSIFIDIGTNGEIVMNSYGQMKAVSTSAGPAFEGMNIECGSRAVAGAIDSFKIKDSTLLYTTISDERPKSICGSGLIDIVSELLNFNIIEKSGKFTSDKSNPLFKYLKEKNFYITDDIFISQNDVRQVQLAKGAISAGIKILLKEFNKNINDIKEILVAGSFGYHLNCKSLLNIGLIPSNYSSKIVMVGNTSLYGATKVASNLKCLEELRKISDNIEVIELSLNSDFQRTFIDEMHF